MKKIIGIVCIIFVALFLMGCTKEVEMEEEVAQPEAEANMYEGKKVLYIDSYHPELPWSAGITEGVKMVLDEAGIEYQVHSMDTKRNPSEEFKMQAALDAKALIESYQPDAVIACDDNAHKYLIMEYYKDAELPFTFCGVNWNIEKYGGPYSNTAGMVEVVLLDKSVDAVKEFAAGDKIAYLTEDTTSEKSNAENLVSYVGLELTETVYVTSLDEWKTKFLELQDTVDILIIGVMGSYADWSDEAVKKEIIDFALENTKIPTVTEHEWMVDFSLLSYGKSAQEQGEFAATSALEIIDGKTPAEVGVVKNKRGVLAINSKIAENLGIVFNPNLIKNAKIFPLE